MSKMQIYKISFFLLLLLNLLTTDIAYAKDVSVENVVTIYINSINDKKWSAIPDLWVSGQRGEFIAFFNNKLNKEQRIGVYNIKKAHLVALKQIPYDYGRIYLPTRYIESFGSPQIFYVAVDYKVFHEDKYHLNGVNYFFIVTVSEGGNRKLALTPHVPVNQIIRDGFGFGTSDEKTFDKRRIKFVQ
jgi:hypothetical protein